MFPGVVIPSYNTSVRKKYFLLTYRCIQNNINGIKKRPFSALIQKPSVGLYTGKRTTTI